MLVALEKENKYIYIHTSKIGINTFTLFKITVGNHKIVLFQTSWVTHQHVLKTCYNNESIEQRHLQNNNNKNFGNNREQANLRSCKISRYHNSNNNNVTRQRQNNGNSSCIGNINWHQWQQKQQQLLGKVAIKKTNFSSAAAAVFHDFT